ncbi:MAG: 2-hydroxyacid dehydrogenase [Gammaproteobacteria bacterium]
MSGKPVVVVGRKLPAAVEARLQRDYDARFNVEDRLYSRGELVRLLQAADAVVPCHTEKLPADVIAELPDGFRAICNYSVGVDHVDLAAAKSRDIVVTNTPNVLSEATAEIAMLLMLGAARRATEGDQLVRAGRWRVWSPAFMVGTQVTGKRLGIVGMGRVGQVAAHFARGFDMKIHYYNRRRLDRATEHGAIYHETLESLLPQCDFLSLHCPATPQTQGLLNRERIAQLPDGAIVINTARGAIVDDDALIEALKAGKLAAAGLDVFNNEPNIDPRYYDLENTFLLPHVGSATHETRDAMGFRALDNLDAIFAGTQPRDRVA